MLDPTDIGPAPEYKVPGDICPECGGSLEFDEGSRGTRHEPEVDPKAFCDCGASFDIDWKRMPATHNDEAKRPERSDGRA